MLQPADIGVVLLAAGLSRRFGTANKLLALIDGQPLVTHAIRPIAELAPGRRIAICSSAEVAELLAEAGFEVLMNDDPGRGLSSSLAIGAQACADLPAMMICLADMPFVGTAHLRRLVAACDPAGTPVACSINGGARMPPAIFAQPAYDRLAGAQGDAGARVLLADALAIEAPFRELGDVDRPEDLPG